MKREAILWWGVGKTVLAGATYAVASLRQYGRERVPRDGGAVLAVNHAHWIDIPVVGALCPRRIVYLAKMEAHQIPVLGPFIGAMGTLAVRRGESDREAIRLARQAVRQNELLGMFVEGTRQKSGEPGEAKPGAAMVAIQEGVPVLPAAIYNSIAWKLGSRTPISIAWGEPMRFAEHPRNSKGYKAATAEIETEIRRLWEFLAEMHRLGRPQGTPPRRASVPSKSE
jgi:1-acyl-sn-glycerol-3-phosphate acyltransferase